jgi:NAD+ kinase
MEKVILFGNSLEKVKSLVKKYGFVLTTKEKEAQFVICYGGDGTLMLAESLYPVLTKILLRGSKVCKKCENVSNGEILLRVKKNRYKILKVWKLEAKVKDKKIFGLNDIVIHNGDVRHAIRYGFFIDNVLVEDEIIGDGVVISTPFGSTGYYRSITKSYFEEGIGLAFNNSTEAINHIVLSEKRVIKILIRRGPAVLYADNQEKSFFLKEKDIVEVKKSKNYAKIVRVL